MNRSDRTESNFVTIADALLRDYVMHCGEERQRRDELYIARWLESKEQKQMKTYVATVTLPSGETREVRLLADTLRIAKCALAADGWEILDIRTETVGRL